MAKHKKAAAADRPRQMGQRSVVALGLFWATLAGLLSEERARRGWSTVVVEKNGGPSYGIVQEHERGNFRSVRALMLHLGAFGWRDLDTFENVISLSHGRLILDPKMQVHVRQLQATSPGFRQSIFDLTEEAARLIAGDAVPQPPSLSAAEFAAVTPDSARKTRAGHGSSPAGPTT